MRIHFSKLSVYQLISLKRLLTMIILHMPSNLVLLHPCPLMHGPPLLHLSLFLPVTQHVSDSQTLFNFVIFPISFSLLFCRLINFSILVLLLLFPFLFSSKFSSAPLHLYLPLVLNDLVSCTSIHFICQ